MGDHRVETITGLLRKQKDNAAQLLELLAPEIMSYETVHAELDRARMELKKMQDEKMLARIEIEKAKETAGSIIQVGKDEAKRLEAITKTNITEKMIEASRILEACKTLALDLEKKRYNKLMDDKEKLEKAA